MKITRMKLVQWRNHAETTLELERLTVIRGDNAGGKTSIGQAIEYTLTGRCDATNEKGAGAAGLIRDGADKAGILLRVQANREVDIKCTLTEASGRAFTVNDPNDAAWNGSGVKQWLESQHSVLCCLLNSRYFIGLKPAEQKALLASIILPDAYTWPEWVCKAALKVQLNIDWNRAPFDVIEAAYKAAFDKRRDINRDLKNLQIPEPIAKPEGAVDPAELAKMRARIFEVEKERRARVAERGLHLTKISGVELRIEAHRAKLRTEQETMSQAERALLSAAKVKELKKTIANEKKLADLERDLATLRDAASGIRAIMGVFEGLKGKQCCPMCQREVTEEWLADAYAPHNDRLRENTLKQEATLDEMKALGDVAGAKRQLEDNQRYTENANRCRGIISETQRLLLTAEEELTELQASLPAEVTDDDPASTELRQKIVAAEANVEAAAVADARAKEIARLEKQRDQLKEAQQTLESLVTYFGPDGVKAEMLKEHVGGFVDAINRSLEAWGYSVAFNLEPYGFHVGRPGGFMRALEFLSGSERLRFAIAFQVALAIASDIRLVVIDEADILDSAARSAFYPLLLDSDLDQAVVIGTSEVREVPDVEGAAFYAMDNGKAERLLPVPEEVVA